MAEQDQGSRLSSTPIGGGVALPYTMRTPTPPAALILMVGLFVAAIIVAARFFPPGTGASPWMLDVAITLFVASLAVVHAANSFGHSGRFGKRVTVDHHGVTISPVLARLIPGQATHLPASGLWCLGPIETVTPDGYVDVFGVSRRYHGEQKPPEQSRVLIGHDDESLRWHSLKTRDPTALMRAVAAAADHSGAGSADLSSWADVASLVEQETAVEQAETVIGELNDFWTSPEFGRSSDSVLGSSRKLPLWSLSIVAVVVTVALQHTGWGIVMFLGAAAPYAVSRVVDSSWRLFGSPEFGSFAVRRRVPAFVVSSRDVARFREMSSYRPSLRGVGDDTESEDVIELQGDSRCPLSPGSPVPVVVRRDGRVRVDHHDQAADLDTGVAFVPLFLGIATFWILWVYDAVFGGF